MDRVELMRLKFLSLDHSQTQIYIYIYTYTYTHTHIHTHIEGRSHSYRTYSWCEIDSVLWECIEEMLPYTLALLLHCRFLFFLIICFLYSELFLSLFDEAFPHYLYRKIWQSVSLTSVLFVNCKG